MRKFWIVIILFIFIAITLLGIERAAAGTHKILGDSGYINFLSEVFS